jgi:hypothetical protein
MNCGYEPELYDLVIPPSWFGDVEWYRKRAEESGGPVLEREDRAKGALIRAP